MKKSLLIIIIWLILVGMGEYILLNYSSTPSSYQPSPVIYPANSTISHDEHTALLFLHPQCPCSKATLEEMRKIITVCPNLNLYIIFVQADGLPDARLYASLWEFAHRIHHKVMVDRKGMEAKKFNVVTSGHTLFYSQNKLRFSGGITGTRGQEGDNPGKQAIISLAKQRQSEISETPVFGCPLL